jgi:hypothetical protein
LGGVDFTRGGVSDRHGETRVIHEQLLACFVRLTHDQTALCFPGFVIAREFRARVVKSVPGFNEKFLTGFLQFESRNHSKYAKPIDTSFASSREVFEHAI